MAKDVRIGIIGAGQLGLMLGSAARNLEVDVRFIDPSNDPPAAVCGEVEQCAFDDAAALDALAESCDVITYEFENVPVAALQQVAGKTPVYPPVEALHHAQDRLREKNLFEELNIPLPGYHPVNDRDDLRDAVTRLGLPLVVKTRRFGYDGKGQAVAKSDADLDAAWEELGGQPLIAEQWVSFDYEVSCIGARNIDGDIAIYPLSRNVHLDGILHTSCSPVDAADLTELASDYVQRLLHHLDYVGVIALELFVSDGELLANEYAPRVHNSGHWSIEGSATSQFENHLRAILNRPLGSTASVGYAGMVNLIGEITDVARSIEVGTLHDYGKSPREGRKLGHITVVTESAEERDVLVEDIGKSVT